MATTRMTFGSLLGMVTNTANAVGDLAGTLGDGVGMLNKFVESASIDQRERHVVHRTTYRSQLIRDSAMDMAKGNADALAFCRESTDNEKLFTAAQSELLAAFAALDSAKS
jgi:hypothetical protein